MVRSYIQRKEGSSQCGAAMVEFAISILVFITTLLLTCEVVRLSFHTLVTQFVVARTVREAVLGSTVADIENHAISMAKRLGVSIGASDIMTCTFNPQSPQVDCYAKSSGAALDLLSVRIAYDLQLMFGLVACRIEAVALGRNEPF